MSNILSISDLAITGNIANTINQIIDNNVGVSIGSIRTTAVNNNSTSEEAYIIPEYNSAPTLHRYNHAVELIPANEFFNRNSASLCPISSYSAAILFADFTVKTLSSLDPQNCTILLRYEDINISTGVITNGTTLSRMRPTSIPKAYTSFSLHGFTASYYNKSNDDVLRRFYLQSQSNRIEFDEVILTLILLKGRY